MSMAPDTQPLASCSACGASIYAEHFARNLAGHWAGKPYCKVCLEAKIGEEKQAAEQVSDIPVEAPELPASMQLHTFHARLNDDSLVEMDKQVNEWLTRNPHVQVQFANTAVGVFEGRNAGPNLILSVFYSTRPDAE